MEKTGIVIQARMTSSRLPGKVLMDIGGKTILEFLIKRLSGVYNNPDIIVATTRDNEDSKIIELCDSLNVLHYKGPRENVLKRYVECAHKFDIDVIIRVCSDCPLIDVGGINELIDAYNKNPRSDLIHNKHREGYPMGTGAELVNIKALEIAEKNATEPYQKEHVIPYILENGDKFNIIKISAPKNLQRPYYYLTIDYQEDLEVLRMIINKIDEKEKIPLRKIIELLDRNPNIVNINSHLHTGFKE